jgi:phosphopentomutase
VTVHAANGAGTALRTENDLTRDDAVTWDFERDFYRRAVGERVPAVEARTAGVHLASIAAQNDLTLFETFLTDLVGHGRIPLAAGDALERLDRFVGGLLAALDGKITLVVCSDHGNIEEPEHARHTRNPVPLIALGPLADRFARLQSIVDLTPAVLGALGIERAPTVVDLASHRVPAPAAAAVSPSTVPGGAS